MSQGKWPVGFADAIVARFGKKGAEAMMFEAAGLKPPTNKVRAKSPKGVKKIILKQKSAGA